MFRGFLNEQNGNNRFTHFKVRFDIYKKCVIENPSYDMLISLNLNEAQTIKKSIKKKISSTVLNCNILLAFFSKIR